MNRLIKLDVDGNEHDVLQCGKRSLEKFKPAMLLELAPYVNEDAPEKFDGVLKLLWEMGYEPCDSTNGRKLPKNFASVRRLIPSAGGIDALATC